MRFLMSSLFVLICALRAEVDNCCAQDFQLVEPSGVISGDVYLSRDHMTVNDANGNQYILNRAPEFDSYDRQYAGYLQPSQNRVVRFPRSGNGLMQFSNLNDAFPEYRFSRRSVRRAAGHPGHPPHHHGGAFIPPSFHAPYGYPSFGYGYQSFGTTLNVGPIGIYPPAPPLPPPIQSVVLDSQVVPRNPLPPVTLDLLNSAAREVRVTVIDHLANDQSTRLRIPPGARVPITVERDAGADRVQHVRTYAPDGSQITREITAFIPPASRYELVVHEWRLQSVAIDRTGKSPNQIEDTQFQGRGLGRFELPPGDQLSGGTIDVVNAALQSGNAGSVTPIIDSPQQTPLRPVSPLEEMIRKQREASGQ